MVDDTDIMFAFQLVKTISLYHPRGIDKVDELVKASEGLFLLFCNGSRSL